MRQTRKFRDVEPSEKKLVDAEGLQILLSAGRGTAEKIGRDANACVRVGKRVLWNVEKIQKYLNEISGE